MRLKTGLVLALLTSALTAPQAGVRYALVAESPSFPSEFAVVFERASLIDTDISLTPPEVVNCGFSGLPYPCTNTAIYLDGHNSWLQGPAGMVAMIFFMDAPTHGGVDLYLPGGSLGQLGVHTGFSYAPGTSVTLTVSTVPEPAQMAMLVAGLAMLGSLRRRTR